MIENTLLAFGGFMALITYWVICFRIAEWVDDYLGPYLGFMTFLGLCVALPVSTLIGYLSTLA